MGNKKGKFLGREERMFLFIVLFFWELSYVENSRVLNLPILTLLFYLKFSLCLRIWRTPNCFWRWEKYKNSTVEIWKNFFLLFLKGMKLKVFKEKFRSALFWWINVHKKNWLDGWKKSKIFSIFHTEIKIRKFQDKFFCSKKENLFQ